MLPGWLIIGASFAYLLLLFAVAYFGDRRADQGRSVIANPWVFSLSLAVYCTAWTYFGSVGRAASGGTWFLPTSLGPTLGLALAWLVVLKMIRIARSYRITSIADFVASRYGKSHLLGGLVTIIAVVGIVPYIALQLKAISSGYALLIGEHDSLFRIESQAGWWQDGTLYIALTLAAFTVLFGTRHLDTTERHEGMVAAIAFESVVKLLAFLAVGIYVTYWLYDGFGDLYARAMAAPELANVLAFDGVGRLGYGGWFAHVLLAMLSVIFLPRQFQIAVVENVNEQHLRRATWAFPAYLLLINIFVIPIAIGGLLHFGQGTVDPDTFVLTLPMAHDNAALALFVFIGGLSAATGMVIVEAIALSTMVCNDLVMPMLLRSRRLNLARERDLTGLLLGIRRGAIVGLLLLGYLYFRLAGEAYALVSIGLISFAAVAQFAPAVLGGMYWRGGTREGALAGLLSGFAVWGYTLMFPRSPSRAGSIRAFSSRGCSAWPGSSRSSSSALAAGTTSATRCSGACSPTSAPTCWSRSRACRPAPRPRRARCSSMCSGAASRRRPASGAPGRSRAIWCRWWRASSASAAPKRPSAPTRARTDCRTWRSSRPTPSSCILPNRCSPARSAARRRGSWCPPWCRKNRSAWAR